MTTRIEVRLAPPHGSPYPVEVGRGLIAELGLPYRRVALLADAAVANLHGARLAGALERAGSELTLVRLPAGEAAKTPAVFAEALSGLARAGLTRDSAVVSLGGGAASDLAGFVAASYLRGIAHYGVPTTLLAMVDASVGGKTGLNLPEGKNLAGAFHQPRGVTADLGTLESLPEPVFREGAAEVFKHGLIEDPRLCDAVLAPGFGPGAADLEATVAAAVRVKAHVVERDPLERGERAHLNLGHTLAHALEAATGHTLSHGDAVGYGLHYASHLSRLVGGDDLTGLTRAFLAYQRPRPLPALEFAALEPFINRDKKGDADGVRFVLLRALARPSLERVPRPAQLEAFAAFRADLLPG